MSLVVQHGSVSQSSSMGIQWQYGSESQSLAPLARTPRRAPTWASKLQPHSEAAALESDIRIVPL